MKRRDPWILRAALIAVAASACVATDEPPPAAAPEHSHPGANQIAVSPNGRFVVTADGNGGVRALDTRDGGVAVVRASGPERAPATGGRLAFTSDGVLVGLPWRRDASPDKVGLRAGTWESVLVPGAPRSIGPFGAVSGLPAGGLPATDCVLPSGGQVLGLAGTPSVRGGADPQTAATQTLYDGTEWTVWEAATGKVVRSLGAFPVSARPRAALGDGESLLALQYHAFLRLDGTTGAMRWWADPFEVGTGAPPPTMTEFLMWALRASTEPGPLPRAAYDVVGVARGGDLAVVSARRPRPTAAPSDGSAAAPGFTVAALDTAAGATKWRHRSESPDATAWIGPGGRTVLLVEGTAARLLDVAGGADVTPQGWPGGLLPVRAAAAEPGGDGLWVLLTDGRVRRLDRPK